jgi:hypothetical protein
VIEGEGGATNPTKNCLVAAVKETETGEVKLATLMTTEDVVGTPLGTTVVARRLRGEVPAASAE